MTSDEFCKYFVSHKGLFTSEEFEDIMLTLTVKEYEPKIFNRNPRTYKWDGADYLLCRRKTKKEGREKYIRNEEVASFSSSHHLLLGSIQSAYSRNCPKNMRKTKVEVTITEREYLSFERTVLPKVLYKGTSSRWIGSNRPWLLVTLPQPIVIKPQRMYEICLKVPSSEGCYYYSDCQPMVEMEDYFKVQFHRNPHLDYDNLANGWISDLIFNEL